MNPKVTLLGESWQTRTMVFGKKKFVFTGGEAREVPVAVALALQKRKDDHGKPVFKVDKMPEIIPARHPDVVSLPGQDHSTREQNVARTPSQRKLSAWPS